MEIGNYLYLSRRILEGCSETFRVGRLFFFLGVLLLTADGCARPQQDFALREQDFEGKRRRMVVEQLKSRDIRSQKVLRVMGRVPRHELVPEANRVLAYEDYPLPIGEGQTISQPYIVALMTQLLDPAPGDRVLEIGTGSGYQAAVLAELAKEVYSIEIVAPLAQRASQDLERLGYSNVHVRAGDGYAGWPEKAPFDLIIITAAAPEIPQPLLDQLEDGGRLIMPVGMVHGVQTLTLVIRQGEHFQKNSVTGVRFVPLTGEAQKNP
jgi:protein-L-isoaspartate(D-aspartate) O-methyltransferase